MNKNEWEYTIEGLSLNILKVKLRDSEKVIANIHEKKNVFKSFDGYKLTSKSAYGRFHRFAAWRHAPWATRGRCCVPSARPAPAPTPGVSLSCAGCLTSLSAVVVSLHMCVRHGSVRSLQKQIVWRTVRLCGVRTVQYGNQSHPREHGDCVVVLKKGDSPPGALGSVCTQFWFL